MAGPINTNRAQMQNFEPCFERTLDGAIYTFAGTGVLALERMRRVGNKAFAKSYNFALEQGADTAKASAFSKAFVLKQFPQVLAGHLIATAVISCLLYSAYIWVGNKYFCTQEKQ